jgi:hypothetical protein
MFSSRERGGKVKHKYHRCNVIWKLVAGMGRSGMIADTSINSIYAVNSQQTYVTAIINAIKKDSKEGRLNPSFRI